MPKIFLPSSSATDWRYLHPKEHWRAGRSAQTLAQSWENADGLPPEVSELFRIENDTDGLLLALPEYKVALPGSTLGASQNDIFALVRAGNLLYAMTVEGKVEEPFGPTLEEWRAGASEGKQQRLDYLCRLLGLSQPAPNEVYYQLLHRAASAVIQAQRFKTDAAVMVIHSFSSHRKWFDAFARFASLFGAVATVGKLIRLESVVYPPLFIAWCCGDPAFLADKCIQS